MIVNTNSTVQHAIQIKNEIIINVNVSIKSTIHAKKDYSWNSSTCICENITSLKCIVDNSVILCDQIIIVADSMSTNVRNAVSTNGTSTVSINSHNKKVRYKMNCYILHTFLLMTIYFLLSPLLDIIMQNIGQNTKYGEK